MDPSYNNLGGFGSGGAMSSVSVPAPISTGSGTGDIVLGPEKKSHKKLIFILVVAALVVGGLFAALFLASNSSNNVNVSNDAKTAFNKYANYLLYGEDSETTLEEEYDEDSIYKIDEMRNENAQVVTNYFKTANELLTNFESLVNGSANSDFIKVVNSYRADFELVRLTFNKEYITEEDLVNEVLNNNLEDAKTWITNKYASLAKSGYENVRKYAEAEIHYYQLYAEYLENLKAKGCFDDGVACDSSMDEVLSSQMTEYEEITLNIRNDAMRSILNNCWTIEKLMGEGGGA